MFKKVLVPIDFSKHSQKVLECIKALPGVKDVVLLHIIGPADPLARVWNPGGRIEEAKVKLAEQKELMEGGDQNIATRTEVVMEGEISRVIQKVADEENISLIAMGARGKGLVEGILLGNVAKDVLRYGSTNLLLMRYRMLEGREGPTLDMVCSQPLSKVLCPTDFSKPAAEAIGFVKEIEGVGEILLQHVIFQGETWKEIDAQKEVAIKKLNAIKEEIESAGLTVKVYASVGSPAQEISKLASKEDVSLIAMSSRGKGWLEQLTVGSTTYDVAMMVDRPVLVVRAGQKALG
jgi:nucleotide-binding universal stress UspA family protein